MTSTIPSTESADKFFNKELFIKALIASFILGLVAHAYCYFNLTYSHDGLLNLAAQTDFITHRASIGRFSQYLNLALRGFIPSPWVIGTLSLIWLSIGNYALLRTFKINSLSGTWISCGLMVTNIAFSVCNATCIHESDNYMLAYMFATLGAYAATHYRKGFILAPILIMLSTGFYQAYFSVSLGVCILWLIIEALKSESFQTTLRQCIKVGSIVIAGIILYMLVYKGILAITGINAGTTYNNLNEASDPTGYIDIFIPLLIGTYGRVIKSFIYTATDHSIFVFVLNVLIFALMGLGVLRIILIRKMKLMLVALIATLLAMLPFAINISFFLGKGLLHELMVFAYILPYFLALLIAKLNGEIKNSPLITYCNTATFGMLGLIVFYNSNNANQIYLQKHLVYQASFATITRMLDELERTEGYQVGETPVVITGSMNNAITDNSRRGFEHVEKYYGFGKNSNITYYSVYWAYFKGILAHPIKLLDEDTMHDFEEDPRVQAMPHFPSPGYIQLIDDTFVVKMAPGVSAPSVGRVDARAKKEERK